MSENKQFTFDRDTVAPNIKTPIVFKEGERLSLGEVLDKLNELQEERDYFEKRKCEYEKKISILACDKITLKSVLEDAETLMELVKEQDKLIDLKMKHETVQLINRLENNIAYYRRIQEND